MFPTSRQAILFVHPVLRVQILEGCHTSVKTDAMDTTVSMIHSSKVLIKYDICVTARRFPSYRMEEIATGRSGIDLIK